MAKLLVKYGKNVFHPHLRINPRSGFCANQWTQQTFREGTFCGSTCVKDTTVAKELDHYMKELQRTGHQPLS